MAEENKSNKIVTYRAGQVTATVWKNTKKSKTGEDFDAFNATIKKEYKDGEVWKETTSYQPDEIANLIIVATEAQRRIKLKTKE